MLRTIILSALFAALALFSGTAFGQDPEGYYEKGKLTEIKDLLSGDELEGCTAESRRYAGTVTAVRFSEGRMIGDFTLRTTRGGSVKIHMPANLYDRISKQDATSLPTLVAKARRITVDTHQCGTTRRALYILAGIHTETLG